MQYKKVQKSSWIIIIIIIIFLFYTQVVKIPRVKN